MNERSKYGGIQVPKTKKGFSLVLSDEEARKQMLGFMKSGIGCGGWVWLMLVITLVSAIASGSAAAIIAPLGAVALIYLARKDNPKRIEKALNELRASREAFFGPLEKKYGSDHIGDLIAGRLWMGAPVDAVHEMFGPPDGVEEKVMKTGMRHTLRYFPLSRGHALKVVIQDDEVTGWDDKRRA